MGGDYTPPKFWPETCQCVGCEETFKRRVGSAGKFCSAECVQTPAHLRRKRAKGTLTMRDVMELEAHAKYLLRRRLMRESSRERPQ